MISKIIQTELLVSAEAKLIEMDNNKEVRIILDIGFISSNIVFFSGVSLEIGCNLRNGVWTIGVVQTRSRPL